MKKILFNFSPDGAAGGTGVSEVEPQEATDNTEKPAEEKSDAELFYGSDDDSKTEGQGEEESKDSKDSDEEQANDDTKDGEEDKGEESPEVDDFGFNKFEVKEGFEVTDEAKELFKGLELDQESSQKLVDYGIKIQEQTIETIAEAQEEAREKQTQEWVAEIEEKHGKELPLAKDFIQKHAPESFTTFLNETGLGNHPEMVGLMISIAKATSEDSFANAPASPTEKVEVTGAQALYGDKYDNE